MRRKSPFLHFLVGAVAITVTTAGASVWLIGPAALESCSKTSYIELPLPDGGRIRNEFWFESGFLDSSYHSEVYYISPGWWVAKEHVFTLAWNQEDTLRTARRTQFYQDGDRKAFAIWRSLGSLAAKRIMMTLPKARLRTWVSAIRDFPCFVRGFQPQDPAAQEVLVATTPGGRPPKSNPGDLVVDLQYGLLGDYNCLYKWDVEVVDLRGDRLVESARDLPADLPRTMVSSSAEYDEEWRFDLDATLAANPNARPLPFPAGVTAVITVIETPHPVPDGTRGHMEAVLELPNARIVCTAQGLLREREPSEISCEGPSVHVPARFRVTPLWGDPNPQLVAVSITGVRIPYGGPLINRYMVVPLGWNIVSPFQYGTGPVESLYFRVERPNPSW